MTYGKAKNLGNYPSGMTEKLYVCITKADKYTSLKKRRKANLDELIAESIQEIDIYAQAGNVQGIEQNIDPQNGRVIEWSGYVLPSCYGYITESIYHSDEFLIEDIIQNDIGEIWESWWTPVINEKMLYEHVIDNVVVIALEAPKHYIRKERYWIERKWDGARKIYARATNQEKREEESQEQFNRRKEEMSKMSKREVLQHVKIVKMMSGTSLWSYIKQEVNRTPWLNWLGNDVNRTITEEDKDKVGRKRPRPDS